MRYIILLNKTKFQVLVILVLCIQMLGPQQGFSISSVNSEGLTGTELDGDPSNEPMLTITSPNTDEISNVANVIISGTVENYLAGMTISLFTGAEQLGTPYEVTSNNWSIPVVLQEGTHTIDIMLVDAGGVTVASTTIANFTIDLTFPPAIKFVDLVDGGFSNSHSIKLTTEPNATVQICTEDCTGSTSGTWETVPQDSDGNWIYSNPQMSEGNQTVYAKAIDRAGNVGPTNSISFILDTLRPTILLNSIVPAYTEDMTQVSINTVIKFRVSDANTLKEVDIDKSISVTSNGEVVPGDVLYDPDTKEFSYILTEGPFTRSTKYNVLISPLGIIDSAGNSAFPRFWSFTTESTPPITDEESGQRLYEIDYNGKNGEKVHRESPHAAYANNVNVCVNCHNTHEASNQNLLDQKQNSENGNTDTSVDNYCMACHDGTVAPMPENSQTTHKHSAAIDIAGKPSGSSCSSCHNPHNDRSEGNPNLAQDHIVYTHDPSIKKNDKPVGKISTKEQLCESCHESGLGGLVAQPDVDVEYRIFQYKKNISAIGIYEDYDLCLRCHNLNTKNKYSKIADIASFYDNLTEETKKVHETSYPELSYSDREFTPEEMQSSKHIIKAQDGSPLAGHLPCAECHDTHGSNNIKQLNTSLGHSNIKSFTAEDMDETQPDSQVVKVNIGGKEIEFKLLSDKKERDFCLACHSDGITAIYGVEGKKYESTRPEHSAYPSEPCSFCHGRGANKVERALSAAHAPKTGIVPE